MRLDLIAAAVLVTACASASPPPGGPEDRLPPRLVRITPDTNAVNVRPRAAVFHFDEVINDRAAGTTAMSDYFLISPSDGEPRVSWHRQRIEVRPRRGFRANTAYTVTLLPGLTDLRNNTMKEGRAVVFSTGATIPTVFISGIAFDWAAERPAPRALIQATTPDSVMYLAQADSSGRFTVGPMTPGTYVVRAIVDQNQNRAQDRGESWDSVRVAAPQSAPVELLTAPRDTLPARILSASMGDSVTLRLTFDRLLDPTQTLAVGSFRLRGADSAAVPLTAVLSPREETANAEARGRAAADSARRADSVAGRPRPPAATPPTPAPGAAADTPRPRLAPPYNAVAIVLGRRLPPGTSFRVGATGIRALSGRSAPSDRLFTTPRAPAPGDTAAAPRATPLPGRPATTPAPRPQ